MEKKKTLSKKILTKLGIAILIITPLLIGLWYMRSTISDTTTTIAQSRKQFLKKSSSLRDLVNLKNQYENFGKAYLNVLYNVIPLKDELINISRQLESVAAQNNIGFGFSFQEESKASDKKLGYLKYSLNITGDEISQIQSFIKDLNNFQYLNTVDSLNIKRKTKEKKEKIKANLEGQIYFRKENTQ